MKRNSESSARILASHLERYSRLGGPDLKPFGSMDQLEIAPDELRARVLAAVASDLSDLERALGPKTPFATLTPDEERTRFEFWMMKLNLRPKGDIAHLFGHGDIVEVYDQQFRQLYRNYVFLRHCSYDLFTLYTTPFPELYNRTPAAEAELIAFFTEQFARGEAPTEFKVRAHHLWEIKVAAPTKFLIQPRYAVPLFDAEGRVVALAITNHCTPIKRP